MCEFAAVAQRHRDGLVALAAAGAPGVLLWPLSPWQRSNLTRSPPCRPAVWRMHRTTLDEAAGRRDHRGHRVGAAHSGARSPRTRLNLRSTHDPRSSINVPAPPSCGRLRFRGHRRPRHVHRIGAGASRRRIRTTVRQWLAQARSLSGEAAADRADLAAAAARDAIRGLQRRRHHAQRRLLRALSQRRHRRPRSTATRTSSRSAATPPASRSSSRWPTCSTQFKPVETRRRQPVLGQQPRPSSTRASPAASSRNGAMGNARWVGVPLKDVLARRRDQEHGQAGHLRRPRHCALRRRRFRQGARHRPRDGRRGDDRLPDERRRPADAQRLSGSPGGAGLLRHLLGQAPVGDRGHRPASSTASG